MYDLRRSKSLAFFLILCFFSITSLSAQFNAKDNYNYLDFQRKPYYFGMSFGYNSSGYRVNHSRQFVSNDSINIVEGANGPGINLQMIGNLKIGEYFDFRILPGFSFAERRLEYTSTPLAQSGGVNTVYTKKVESVFAEIPFQLRFKSAPYKDKRMYVMAGAKYSYDVESGARVRKDRAARLVQISPHDFQIEYGVGMQFFMPFFIFSPEIKISQGLGNIHIYKANLNDSSVLETVKSRIFTISFHFEG